MAKIYNIPDNFIDGGKVLGGVFKTRNFIEGLIMGGILGFVGLQIPVSSLQARLSVVIFMAAPGLMLGIAGINNDPFSVFVRNVYLFSKNRKVMLFNGTARGRTDNIVDRMLAQKTPQELLANQLKVMKAKSAEEEEETLVEGIDFIFEEDTELTKYLDDNSGIQSFGKKKKSNSESGDTEENLVNIADLLGKQK